MNSKILPFFLLLAMPLQAEVQRWVDAEGNVHFGDTVPPEHRDKSEAVEFQPLNTVAPETSVRDHNSRVVNNYRDQDRRKAIEAQQPSKQNEQQAKGEPHKLTREYCRDMFTLTKARTECFRQVEKQNAGQ
ncbi:DUF4124 domain-containing protein [Agaribacterium haliotis]|uniref:DUF4124 domain-containing protein n=1 Tax=Agaribacterium haliotis TaxID=2013869 RepID=UPI0011782E64|nr:DUF4124 domain-containing protein [Agaribacterium haliotis]